MKDPRPEIPGYDTRDMIDPRLGACIKSPLLDTQAGSKFINFTDIEGKTENSCLRHLNRGYADNNTTTFCGKGNRLVMGGTLMQKDDPFHPGKTYAETFFKDATLADLRHAFDGITLPNNIFESDQANPYYIRKDSEWVKGVKVSCDGEMRLTGKQRFSDVDVRTG